MSLSRSIYKHIHTGEGLVQNSRTLEKRGKLGSLVSWESDTPDLQVIYRSHFEHGEAWSELMSARRQFGEMSKFATEPDLILYSPQARRMCLIEAKLGSNIRRKTQYSDSDLFRRREMYEPHRFFGEVFKEAKSFESVVDAGYYELLRQWILGT